jgi:hypothetical protein
MQVAEFSLLALLLIGAGGCPDRTVTAVPLSQGKVEVKDISAVAKRDVDILFLIDDSLSMADEQEALKANFPKMVEVLETLEGGLPDIQIGVVTPNLGTSAIDGPAAASLPGCNGSGEDGVLRTRDGTGPRFIRDVDDHAGGRARNYTGTLAEAFSDFASVGVAGCGVEQHLRAIERATLNPMNTGFLRDNAYLAVVVIADEDDCSLQTSALFDASDRNASDYGKKTNFRCTSQGVVCDSPATSFDIEGEREDCHPADTIGEVSSVDRYVDHVKSLKADARDIVVAGIVGDPQNFTVVKDGSISQLANACPNGGTTKVAFPGVRHSDFLAQFQNNVDASICQADLSGPLKQIGTLIRRLVTDDCFENDLLDIDPSTPEPDYECSVTEVRRRPGMDDEEVAVLPGCDTGRFPCWRVEEDALHCGFTNADPHLKLVVDFGTVSPDPDLRIKANCVTADKTGPVL